MTDIENEHWDTIIEPRGSLLDLKLKDVWQYRDLLVLLVRRDFVAFYKQTILGPIWFFIQPVITVVFYTFVFGNLAGIPTDGVPKPLFYLAGTILWNYFADCLTKTSTVFKDNSALMSKVYFPRLIMPLSVVASNLIRFAVQLVLFIAVAVFYFIKGANIEVNIYALLFPFLVVLIAAQGLGLGMIISAVTTKYRDLAFVVTFGVPLLMYATTVIYPLSEAEAKFPRYSWVIKYNPITTIIETFRYGLLGKGSFDIGLLAYCTIATVITLLVGVIIYNKVEKNFVDTI
ncbi:ABC transporter permease [Mucilaginibacter achroorhodeus]|uniref:Transport permease protein n=1 Tax=Mucilaginibacter achroorhodeus TaxID=2599294 RepID=A0A563U9B9_9SPHI|nr:MULTISPECIES: ABC transporter permease [Mucilaginibacter]QXV67088.1 ABC transporter permease [Mucilaginibacter sp. 21P]TWR27945.1 ABC transporter permease [Mucilaginibacter achroorhodeus]